MDCGIYKIQNLIDGKIYIGASLCVPSRIKSHKKRLRRKMHANKYLQNAYDKFGSENFSYRQILACEEKDLDFYEDLIIKGLRSNNNTIGYNLRSVSRSNRGMIFDRKTFCKGQKFGRLTLVERHEKFSNGKKWKLLCDCGSDVIANVYAVKRGAIASCGCLMSDARQARLRYKEGDKFNRITLVKRSHKIYVGKVLKHFWNVKCDCGTEKVADIRPIVAGKTKSCGCALVEFSRKLSLKHGLSGTKEYKAWMAMRRRSKKTGAIITGEWGEFTVFLENMGACPPDGELLRKDRSKPFSMDNCYWGTSLDSSRNRKNNVYVELCGERMLLTDANKILNIERGAIRQHGRRFNKTHQQACDHFARKKGFIK